MLYNSFVWMIRPFINARGNSLVFPPEAIQATINVCVQQIYNEYKWSWQLVDEDVTTFTELPNYFTADITHPIKYILWLEYTDDGDNTIELFCERSRTQIDEDNYAKLWQKLLLKEEHDYVFTYIKNYTFLQYSNETSLDIPVPDSHIPALYYLVLSQLDLIDVQQLVWQPANNFNKYQYEMKNLKDNDIWYELQLIWANPK